MGVVYSDNTIVVSMVGLEEINKRLDQLEQHIRRRLLVDAMKTSMKKMLAFAEAVCVKGNGKNDLPQRGVNVTRRNKRQGGARYSHRGGHLSRSFKIVKPRSNDLYSLETRLINTAYYARWVEYGHNIVKGKGRNKKVVGWSAPRPFMRPTFEASKNQVVNDLATLIGKALTRRGV